MIFDKQPEIGSKWERTFWVRAYLVSTVGNIADDAIKNIYMNNKKKQKKE